MALAADMAGGIVLEPSLRLLLFDVLDSAVIIDNDLLFGFFIFVFSIVVAGFVHIFPRSPLQLLSANLCQSLLADLHSLFR